MVGWLFSPLAILTLTLSGALAMLARLRYSFFVSILILAVGIGNLLVAYQLTNIPLPQQVALPESARVYDRHGQLIGTFSDVRRFIIDTDRLPAYVKEAVISAEDRDFYEHQGVSPRGILRAAWANISGGGIQQGGSTITQQYVKNALLHDSSRTIARKIKEAVLAVKLEDRYTKEQILGFYLNTIYMGRGAYGIEAAARTYFDVHARQLSLPQAAFIAGILRAPEAYQPDSNPEGAEKRRNEVLDAMRQEKYITGTEETDASREPIALTDGFDERQEEERSAYFMEWLRKTYLYPVFKECLYTCGLEIHTTLDLGMQRAAEDAIAGVLDRKSDPQAALVAVAPNGQVRAFVGGRSFHDAVAATGFDFATDFPGRQAGSALKPFTLLAALEDGISPYQAFSGASPITIKDGRCAARKGSWKVSNYGGSSYGAMSLDQATAFSVNTIYAQLASEVGPQSIADVLTRFGFDRTGTSGARAISPYCSLALGSLDVTPLEMGRAYAGLAAKGRLPAITPIEYVTDRSGHCLRTYVESMDYCDEVIATEPQVVAKAEDVESLTNVLGHVVEGGTGHAADIGVPVAGKTGTSQNNVDAWFAGYVPNLATAVWAGYPAEEDGARVPQMRVCGRPKLCRPVRGRDATGGTLSAEIWGRFMKKAVALLDHKKADKKDAAPTGPSQPVVEQPSATPAPVGKPEKPRATVPPPAPTPTPSPTPLIDLPPRAARDSKP